MICPSYRELRPPGVSLLSAGLIGSLLLCGQARSVACQEGMDDPPPRQSQTTPPPQDPNAAKPVPSPQSDTYSRSTGSQSNPKGDQPPAYGRSTGGVPTTPARQTPSKAGNHQADTRPGNNVGGLSKGEDAGIAAGIAGAAIGGAIWFHHHEEHKLLNPDQLSSNGPNVPKNFDMNHFIVEGFIGPDWPVALDFTLDAPGAVKFDIVTSDHQQYSALFTNGLHGRGIAIIHPKGLPDKVQIATFDVEAVAPQGSNGPVPTLRVYGMAAGPKAVGSIAIDEVTFGPSNIRMKQTAEYGFHSHSDFSNVRADFIYTFLKDSHIVMKQESEDPAGPVAQGDHAQGTWIGKGSEGQHMLQIRAWRGYAADWVVAWSPDVVVVAK